MNFRGCQTSEIWSGEIRPQAVSGWVTVPNDPDLERTSFGRHVGFGFALKSPNPQKLRHLEVGRKI